MNASVSTFADECFAAVQGYVARCLAPLRARVDVIEKRAPERGLDGKDGKDGIDGEPGAKGMDGRDGLAGEHGRDAALIEPLGAINPERNYPRGTWAKHAGGLWLARATTEGMSGWDNIVVGLAALEIVADGPRKFTIKSVLSDGQTKIAEFETAAMLDKGAWAPGEYEAGDTVSWDGSMWICREATTERPGTPSWRMAVKKGRDGKDGVRGAKGDRGADGRAGQDLTQLGFDGKRY